MKRVLLLVLIGPLVLLLFAEGQEFGGYVGMQCTLRCIDNITLKTVTVIVVD